MSMSATVICPPGSPSKISSYLPIAAGLLGSSGVSCSPHRSFYSQKTILFSSCPSSPLLQKYPLCRSSSAELDDMYNYDQISQTFGAVLSVVASHTLAPKSTCSQKVPLTRKTNICRRFWVPEIAVNALSIQ